MKLKTIPTVVRLALNKIKENRNNEKAKQRMLRTLETIDLDQSMKLFHSMSIAIGDLRKLNAQEKLDVVLMSVRQTTNDIDGEYRMIEALQKIFGVDWLVVIKLAREN